MSPNDLSHACIGAAFEVHDYLGPGLLERSYQFALKHELEQRGFGVEAEVPIAVQYKGLDLGMGYRIDLLVERLIVIECKCVARVLDQHEAQLLTYLLHGRFPVGLLFNFSALRLKHDMVRKVNGRFPL